MTPPAGSWSALLTLSASGAHTLAATAVDAAGNESAPSASALVTVGP